MTLVLFLAFPAAADAATVKVVECAPSLDPLARTATFEARMRAARGSERMQVRFGLQVREDAIGGWRRISAEGFDTWLTSQPGVRRYTYAKTLINLAAPAAYRTSVRFRWLDEDGSVVKSARITSAACRQPDMRPDLTVRRIEVLPGADARTRRYAVTVRNTGRGDADPFAVTLWVGEGEPSTLFVAGLAAGTSRVVTFAGRACAPGEPLLVTLDPGETVDERDELDNAFAAPCPA
jgi:hypothetical protein